MEFISNPRSNEEQAFELLFRKYNVRLCGFANKFIINRQESEEIVQEAFLKIWNNREEISLIKAFKAYLFTIFAKNGILNTIRKSKSEQALFELRQTSVRQKYFAR
jgi:RNA polymerase sigma-70 factor (ECF subfamily)